MHLHLDFETFSTVDIKKVTTSVYTSHPETEVLMLAWAVDDGPISLWETWQPAPGNLLALLRDPSVILHAYNVPFERGLILHKLGIETPIERWRDTMVEAFALSFPAGLDNVLEAIGLEKKDPRGSRLIQMFSKPAPKSHRVDRYDRHNRPDEWKEFCDYCVKDVEVERRLHHWLKSYGGMSDEEWGLWFLDQQINGRGLPVDREMADGALHVWHRELAEIKDELSRITGLSPVTRGPFLQWLEAQGCVLPDTQKDTIRGALQQPLPSHVHRALTLWGYKEVRALDKYKVILNTEQQGRVCGVFQFAGASRTRRWAGRLLQPHNLKRTLVKPGQIDALAEAIRRMDLPTLKAFWTSPISELLGSAIRHAVCAEDGKVLVAADLGSIESRVLGWFTYCARINRVFESDLDTYKDFASTYFGIPYDQVTKEQRTFSKPPVLGAGFGLGWRGMIAYAEGYGVPLDENKAKRVVEIFRSTYQEIPAFWAWIDAAVKHVVTTGNPVSGYKFTVYMNREFLCIRLPSGRDLWYFRPEVRMHETPWGEMRPTFSYMGQNDKNQWARLHVHPGLLTENCTQAIARDFLAYGMQVAAKKGLKIVLHVHDEIVCEEKEEHADAALRSLIDSMCINPPWAPDIILGADGYIAKRYRKD